MRRRPHTLRVYLDANVVINWIAQEAEALQVVERVLSARHYLVSSPFFRLEVEPQHGPRVTPMSRFRAHLYFGAARASVVPSRRVLDRALELRTSQPLGAMDALHLAVAELGGVDLFVTAENPRTKPMHRVRSSTMRVMTPDALLRALR